MLVRFCSLWPNKIFKQTKFSSSKTMKFIFPAKASSPHPQQCLVHNLKKIGMTDIF